MKTCTNTCGNFTCDCKDSPQTILDIYDNTKCYQSILKIKNFKFKSKTLFFFQIQGSQIRDFIFYLYLKKISFEVLAKNIKVTIESCNKTTNESLSNEFQIKLNSFHETLMQMKGQYWFPIYIDNTNWSSIEFICSIQLKILMLSDSNYNLKDFKYVNKFISFAKIII